MKHRLNNELIEDVVVICKEGSTNNYLWLEIYWRDCEIGTASFNLDNYQIFDVMCYEPRAAHFEILKNLFFKERTNLINWIHSL